MSHIPLGNRHFGATIITTMKEGPDGIYFCISEALISLSNKDLKCFLLGYNYQLMAEILLGTTFMVHIGMQ